jgi:hypothetical protein
VVAGLAHALDLGLVNASERVEPRLKVKPPPPLPNLAITALVAGGHLQAPVTGVTEGCDHPNVPTPVQTP